ncbi:hypothetical protein [Paenibacillus etheri]|uniref:DUF5105 domain-containing protein n=1 Tax=Paenibacillus etheri TaxID=1306852 RepID=A0A0W1AWP4_9BACL|nr:hypothetical protein [Paenibacillus etheri]KTD85785.1 hypothetical protein UQ64_20100 [Paenibacillus etheri]
MNKKLVVGIFVLGFAVTSSLYAVRANASVEKQIDQNLNGLAKQLQTEVVNKTDLSMSSNPYDYIKNSTEYSKIVNLGPDAIPILEKKIDESEGSGLFDYIFATAIEEISKVNLKEEQSTTWDTGNKFSEKWKVKLSTLPGEVEKIANSDLSGDEKITSLKKLGLPAVPFIIDQVEGGKTELFPVVQSLVPDSQAESLAATDEVQWAKENKDKFDDLKKYVLSKNNL